VKSNRNPLKKFRRALQKAYPINARISMQHSTYQIAFKYYIDKKEIAKEMVKQGFRVLPKQVVK